MTKIDALFYVFCLLGFHLSGEVSTARQPNSSTLVSPADLPPGYTTLVEENPSKYKVSVNFDRWAQNAGFFSIQFSF